MKNWYKTFACLLVMVFVSGMLFAEEESETSQVPQPPAKDEKRTLTVMTTDTKPVEIKKPDLLNDFFTPIGDVTHGIIKGASDLVGAGCGACVRAFDETMRWMLTPFGFKPEPSERRAYLS